MFMLLELLDPQDRFGHPRQDFFSDNPAAVDASDGAQARPRGIPHKPKAGQPSCVRYRPLSRITQPLAESPHSAAWPVGESLIGSRRGQFANDRTLSQSGIDAARI